jgi:hypothetical protein
MGHGTAAALSWRYAEIGWRPRNSASPSATGPGLWICKKSRAVYEQQPGFAPSTDGRAV